MAIRARTIRPDGSIADFDGKVFDKSIAKAKGLKYLAKTFTLPDVQVGSIIEYYYTIDLAENFVFDSHWILSNELFTKSAKILTQALPLRLQHHGRALELAGPASGYSAAGGGRGPCCPAGGQQYSRLPDGRLHAPGERDEVAGGLYL